MNFCYLFHFIDIIKNFVSGLFLSGYFNFIGKQNEYSSGVLQYDTGADQFIGKALYNYKHCFCTFELPFVQD